MKEQQFKLVSILVPVYNHAHYILECLNSIFSQTYNNIEIIICDDGSTDDSYKVVHNWVNNKNIAVKLFSQKNKGVCKTLNFLLSVAEGDYIAICASDDILTPKSIEERVEFLNSSTDFEAVIGDADLIGTNSKTISSSAMKSLYKADYSRLASDICSELLFNWSVVGPTFLARKELYDKIGKYDESLLVEDRDFYLRLLAGNYLGFIPVTVAKYRVHSDNASRRNIKSRMVVLRQIAISNTNHAGKFTGSKRLFLLSHHIDLFFCNISSSKFIYFILFVFRGVRKLLYKLVLNSIRLN
jgi:alpha-1,3-rhamnosyltransferase